MKWLRMRPADVTELDETRRYWDERGEDEDRPDEDDMNMVDVADGGKGVAPANRARKQARTRRRTANGSGVQQAEGSPMDTNGNGVGAAAG
jgi:casein kinase II subunit beta